jgi:preprotein translocase subunit SecA
LARIRLARSSRGSADAHATDFSGADAVLRWCREAVIRVGDLETAAQAWSDEELRGRTEIYRARLGAGEGPDSLLPEAFATVREAARRTLGLRPHDVQVMGGAVLHLGKVAQMRTGEGKTLTATLPAYVAALAGKGVHVMTANDYLAARDWHWMSPVYESLGLTTGLLRQAATPEPADRRAAYAADVTYGSWGEFGYDFLRDNLAWQINERVQRDLELAIVDEADLVLIDQMRAPLQITSPAADQPKVLQREFAAAAAKPMVGRDYECDRRAMTVNLTEHGTVKLEGWLSVDNLYDERNLPVVHLLENALKAKEFYARDRDYLVSGDKAVVIDVQSGRPAPGRRYGEGIHEAIEAKEDLAIRPRRQVLASVLERCYLREYRRVAGMTGTGGQRLAGLPRAVPARRCGDPDQPAVDTSRPSGRAVPNPVRKADRARRRSHPSAGSGPAGLDRHHVTRGCPGDLGKARRGGHRSRTARRAQSRARGRNNCGVRPARRDHDRGADVSIQALLVAFGRCDSA